MNLNSLKGVIYDVIGYLAYFGKVNVQRKNKALILRVDEIGDYILWRKFISPILQSNKLLNYEVHFVGNQSWQSLFDLEFKSTFQKTFWLDKTKFKKNMYI